MADLTGKTAVVLGCSAESGCGWAIAEALGQAGARVVVAARTRAPLERLADRIGGLAIPCDAANGARVAELMQTATERFGPIWVAVNAAGDPVDGTIMDAGEDAIRSALDTNYIANVHFIREAAARMQDGGSIVLLSTLAAAQPAGAYFPYACAKAATDCLVRYAAVEFGGRGIRVNSVQPGPIRTDLAGDLYDRPGVEQRFAAEIPLGRIGLPRDYADVVLWLAGPAFVTGLNIPVCGGNQLTRLPRAADFLEA